MSPCFPSQAESVLNTNSLVLRQTESPMDIFLCLKSEHSPCGLRVIWICAAGVVFLLFAQLPFSVIKRTLVLESEEDKQRHSVGCFMA